MLSGFQPHTHSHLGKSGEFFGSIFTIQVVKRVSLQHKKTFPFQVSIRKGGTRQQGVVTLTMSPLTGRLQALSKKTTRMAVERPAWSCKQTDLIRSPMEGSQQPLPSGLARRSLTTQLFC